MTNTINGHNDVDTESDIFDAHWYRSTYADVDFLGMDPAKHYAEYGKFLGRQTHSDTRVFPEHADSQLASKNFINLNSRISFETNCVEPKVLGRASLPKDSVIQVIIRHRGIEPRSAQFQLRVLNKKGEVLARRNINKDQSLLKTVFLTATIDEDASVVVSPIDTDNRHSCIDLDFIDFIRLQDRPQSGSQLHFTEESISVSMATYPARIETLPDSVNSLVGQCDNLLIYLNNYREVPRFLVDHPKKDKIHYIMDTASELRAAAKFTWANRPGFHMICDDDIIYPRDYCKTLISRIEKYQRRAVVGVHAANLKETIPQSGNHRLEVFRFQEGLREDCAVNLIGTGTMGYHSSTVKSWEWSLLLEHKISNDEAVAVLAKRNKVPLVCIARSEKWMASHENMNFGIYEEKSLMPEVNAKVLHFLRENQPWLSPEMSW